MSKKLFVLILLFSLIIIIILKVNVKFSTTVGKVVDSQGIGVADVQILYNYRCGQGESNFWQTDNSMIRTDLDGQFEVPGYRSFRYENINILLKCSKQIYAYKEGYAAYKNVCMQSKKRIGKDWSINDTVNYCGDLAFVGPSTDKVLMKIDLIDNAPNYDPNLPSQSRY